MCKNFIVLTEAERYMPPLPILLFPTDYSIDRMVGNGTVLSFQDIDIQQVREISQRRSSVKEQSRHGFKCWLL